MGQASISMLNKVGHSMFWNSMWDHKIYYNRFLKEDLFLNKFLNLSFGDSLTTNFIKFNKKSLSSFKYYNYNTDNKKKSIYKFLLNSNKVKFFSSKIWILKYQKWVILCNFLYLLDINNINFKNVEKNFTFKDSFLYNIKSYNNKNTIFKKKYNFYKNKQYHTSF